VANRRRLDPPEALPAHADRSQKTPTLYVVAVHLLFVSTGNVCRSPVAERLTFSSAQRYLGAEADRLHITSAGLEAEDGRPMDSHSAKALSRLGGNAGGFRSRRFTAELAETADLVITMTRQQRKAVLVATPRGLRRTFTLLEAADLLRRADADGLENLPLGDRARQLALRLDAARSRRVASEFDDIPDPIGRPSRFHQAMASTINRSIAPLAAVLLAESPAEATGASHPGSAVTEA
jgi:protein-tyrosine phosphatase